MTSVLTQIYDIVKIDNIPAVIEPEPEIQPPDHNTIASTPHSSPNGNNGLLSPTDALHMAIEISSNATGSTRSMSHSPSVLVSVSSRHTTPVSEQASPTPSSHQLPPAPIPVEPPKAKIPARPAIAGPPRPQDLRPDFLHPPFTTFPDSRPHPEGISYDLMSQNLDWFLDPNDFVSADGILYPIELEPPNTKTENDDEGEERRLRCTFCRRVFSGDGEEAVKLWKKHVGDLHGIPLGKERDKRKKEMDEKKKKINEKNIEKDEVAISSSKSLCFVFLKTVLHIHGLL